MALGFLLSASMSLVATTVAVQAPSATRVPHIDRVNAEDLYRARHVIARFMRTERRPECYEVLFSQFEGNLRVDFVPKHNEPVFYTEGQTPPAVEEPCGRNVGYVIDGRGRVLRRIFSR